MTGPDPMQIDSWELAEANAARWMRHWGYLNVTVSKPGADAGVDVRATGALAQVKYEAHLVGRPALQRLVGARGRNSEIGLLFFTGAGYSNPATQYAHEMGIALFTYTLTGAVQPLNAPARIITDRTNRMPPSTPAAPKPHPPGPLHRNPSSDAAASTPTPPPSSPPAPTPPPAPSSVLAGVLVLGGVFFLLAFVVNCLHTLISDDRSFLGPNGLYILGVLALGVLLLYTGIRRHRTVTERHTRHHPRNPTR